MSSTLDHLVRMVNQIARNLATRPDTEVLVADHIVKYWDPRMKAMIRAHLAEGGEGLDPVSAAAVRRLPASGTG